MTHNAEQSISGVLGIPIQNFFEYHDGFSFTVETELQAYKAAHAYEGRNIRTVVTFAPNVRRWSVRIYKLEAQS